MNRTELYDAGLARLNDLQRLTAYCDSLYAASYQNKLLHIKKIIQTWYIAGNPRFYHGYSYYGFNDNYLAFFFKNQ
jgi:hypothetical protein